MSLYLNNPPQLIPSLVCHIDILGYGELCKKAINSDEGAVFLNKVRNALNSAYARVREHSKTWNGGQNRFEIKIFTDNIVVGYPIRDYPHNYAEEELGNIFDVFSDFQLGLAMDGFLVRGGIAFGKHYMDADIVFGDALIEAVKQDNTGGAPKISLSPTVVDAVQHQLGFYSSNPKFAPQPYYLLQDVDDSIFINYLKNAFNAFPEGGVFYEVFIKHKETLINGLTANKGIPSVRAKYEWAARYHNSVIDSFLAENPIPIHSDSDFDEVHACAVEEAQKLVEYKIDIESLAEAPSKLTLKPLTAKG